MASDKTKARTARLRDATKGHDIVRVTYPQAKGAPLVFHVHPDGKVYSVTVLKLLGKRPGDKPREIAGTQRRVKDPEVIRRVCATVEEKGQESLRRQLAAAKEPPQ